MNTPKLSASQIKDRTLGLVAFTRPLEEKLLSSTYSDERDLAEIVSALASVIAGIRMKNAFNLDESTKELNRSAIIRDKLELIRLITQL